MGRSCFLGGSRDTPHCELGSTMLIIKQPENSTLCGQCTIAMLTGQPLEAVVAVLGESRTWPRDVRRGFIPFGAVMAKRSQPYEQSEGQPAAVFLESREPPQFSYVFRHWVAWDGQTFYDPNGGEILTHDGLMTKYPHAILRMYLVVTP